MLPDLDISTDQSRIDLALVQNFLSQSYWAKGRSMEVVERSIRYSLCFGAYLHGQQVAFARLITDQAVFAYLMDVFVVSKYQGQGISKMLMEKILCHPDIKDVGSIMLATRDAHGLYARYGFKSMIESERYMELALNKA